MHETFRKHCVDPRPSLRKRLFLALLAIFVIAWICAAVYISAEMMRDRGGLRDRWLVDVAQEILLSMPSAVVQFKATDNLQLGEERMPATEKMGRMNFQVWSKAGRVLAVRSSNAPAPPLKPDFADGFATVMVDGEEWRVYATSDARNEVQVQIAKPTAEFIAETRKWIRIGVGLSLVALCLIGIALKLVIRWTMRSIVAMQETMKARDALDLRPLPDGDLPDEVLPLVDSFNRLLARLDGAVQSERQFLAEAAHELRTPLAAMRAEIEALQDGVRTFDERTALRMHRQVIRLGQLVDDLRSSMREPQNDLLTTAVFPLALLKEALDHTRDRFAQRGIAVDREAIDRIAASAQPVIDGDAHRLHQVFMNLLENTLAYTDAGGQLRIDVTVEGAWTGNCLTLLFDDSAPGVSDEEIPRLFDRLFRGETSRSRALGGSGLGLSICRATIEAHGGSIEAAASPLGGLRMTITLPLAASA